MNSTINKSNLTEISFNDSMRINGGAAPVLLLAWAFAKGFAAGAGAAGTVHLAIQGVDKATS